MTTQYQENPSARVFSSRKVERVHDFLIDGMHGEDMQIIPVIDPHNLSRLVGIGRITLMSQEG